MIKYIWKDSINRFKELREETILNQTEYAKLFNLSKQTVSCYENGSRFPDKDIIEKITEYHRYSVDYLLGKTYKRKWDTEPIAFNTVSVDGLDEDEIEHIRGIIELLKKHGK